MPIVRIIVKGSRGEKEYDAYLDTGAGRTLIPERDAIELGLPYVGDTPIITGSGKDAIKVFMATVIFLGREFYIPILGRNKECIIREGSTIEILLSRTGRR